MANLSKFSKNPRTHDQARAIVCCACGRKVKKSNVHVLSEKFENLVRKFVFDGFSVHNTAHPTALCVTCRLALSDLEKVGLKTQKRG